MRDTVHNPPLFNCRRPHVFATADQSAPVCSMLHLHALRRFRRRVDVRKLLAADPTRSGLRCIEDPETCVALEHQLQGFLHIIRRKRRMGLVDIPLHAIFSGPTLQCHEAQQQPQSQCLSECSKRQPHLLCLRAFLQCIARAR